MKDELKQNELNDDQLEAISGGTLDFRDPDGKKNPGDVEFRFNVGDHVEVLFCSIVFYGEVTDRAEIISREAKLDHGLYYPYYKTRRLKDKKEEWNFEDRLSY
ncbi:MAG: hypothetical protein PUC32_05940 [Oscillospiraceae bacterium]|nr:hypothetical protein [Oscillospiraceae bacterium]